MRVVACGGCGADFAREGSSRRLYCSEACRLMVKAARKREWRAANVDRAREHGRRYRARHPELVAQRLREWQKANPDKLLAQKLKKYNITPDEYWERLAQQANACGICGSPTPGAKRWHVDHDHSCCPGSAASCGKCVRGLLCHGCNLGLGQFQDSEDRLLAALEYLRSRRAR